MRRERGGGGGAGGRGKRREGNVYYVVSCSMFDILSCVTRVQKAPNVRFILLNCYLCTLEQSAVLPMPLARTSLIKDTCQLLENELCTR
jgi:hypothetical protein